MGSEHDLLMFSSSPQPSCFDNAEQRILSPQNVMGIPCHPSEDDDFTVSDSMKRKNADILNLMFGETCLTDTSDDAIRQDIESHELVGQSVQCLSGQHLNFPIEEDSTTPESATYLKPISVVEECKILESDDVEHNVNLHSVYCDQLGRIGVNQNLGKRQVFHDGLGREKNHDIRPVEFGPVPDEVDWPGHDAGSPDGNDVVTLRKNYQKLLEKHQQFIVSNVQLHELNDELLQRVKEVEEELEITRLKLEQETLDKVQLINQISSLQKMCEILEEKIPKLSSVDNMNNSPDERGEWTSSLKEELRQTMVLAVTQQQELNELHKIIKQQNEAITRLSCSSVHSRNDKKNLKLQLNDPKMPQNELRHKPEGSSVVIQGDERSKVRISDLPKKFFQKTFASGIVPKNLPDERLSSKHKDMTSSTVNKSSKQTPTVSKGSKETRGSSCHLVTAGVKGPPTMYPKRVQGLPNSISQGCSSIDLENSSFVFVDPSHVEIRICPLCNAEFSSGAETLEEFVEHVSRCNPPEEGRRCPVCSMKFDQKYTQNQIEMHVNEHFDEDHFQCLSPLSAK